MNKEVKKVRKKGKELERERQLPIDLPLLQ